MYLSSMYEPWWECALQRKSEHWWVKNQWGNTGQFPDWNEEVHL